MPRYTVSDPDSGKSIVIEGDSPPTEKELIEIFGASKTAAAPAPAPAAAEEAPVKPMDAAMMAAAARAGGGGMVGGYPINLQQAQNAAGFLAEAGLPAAGQAIGASFGPPGMAAGGFLGGAAGKLAGGIIRGEAPTMGEMAGAGVANVVPGKSLRDMNKARLALEAAKQVGAQVGAGATEAAIEGRSMTPQEMAARAGGAVLGTIAGKTFDFGSIADAETAKQIQNSIRDDVIKKAQATGAKLLPSDVNISKVNRLIEALGGKKQLVGDIKELNEEWATNMAAKATGLPAKPAVLTQEVLENARNESGKVYDTIERLRDKAQSDLEILQKPLLRIGDRHEMEVALADKDVMEKTAKLTVDAAAKVNEFRRAQFEARSFYKMWQREGDPKLLDKAKEAEESAMVLANKIKTGLESMGKPELWKEFEAARKRIAMIHQVEDALNIETGSVSGKALSQALNRGAPLTDELRTVAAFAGQPKSSKYFAAGEAGNLESKGVTSELIDAAIRKPVRNVVMSPAYQRFMAQPSYGQATPDFLARMARSGTSAAAPGSLLQFYSELYPRKQEQAQLKP